MSSEIQQLMQILDTNKENMPENDYIQMCNLMKNLYDMHRDNNNSSEQPVYFQIIYKDTISDIIIAQKKKLPFHNAIIRVVGDVNEILNNIELCVEEIVFNTLSHKTYSKIIERHGGREHAYEKMKTYIGNNNYDNFMRRIQTRSKIVLEKALAYYIIDKHFIQFLHIDYGDNIDYAINADDFERVCLNLM